MNGDERNSSNAFAEVAINKMEKQDKKIQQMEDLLQKQIQNNTEIKGLINAIERLQQNLGREIVDANSISTLRAQMDEPMTRLTEARLNEVVHHHHVPKIIWGTLLLAVVICLVCTAWFNTARKLNSFIASDTKYRALKLDTAAHPLQEYLDRVDSVYNVNPDLRDSVLQKEREYLDNFYRVQKAVRLKEEARKLEREAGRK